MNKAAFPPKPPISCLSSSQIRPQETPQILAGTAHIKQIQRAVGADEHFSMSVLPLIKFVAGHLKDFAANLLHSDCTR